MDSKTRFAITQALCSSRPRLQSVTPAGLAEWINEGFFQGRQEVDDNFAAVMALDAGFYCTEALAFAAEAYDADQESQELVADEVAADETAAAINRQQAGLIWLRTINQTNRAMLERVKSLECTIQHGYDQMLAAIDRLR